MIKDNWTIVRIFKNIFVYNFYVSRMISLTTPSSAPDAITFHFSNKDFTVNSIESFTAIQEYSARIFSIFN